MTVAGWIEIALFLALLTVLTPVIGGYMARVFRGDTAYLGFVERAALPPARRRPGTRSGLEGATPAPS